MLDQLRTPSPISREEASSAGLKRYFTGRPCKHGHLSERLVCNHGCLECDKMRMACWRAGNPEQSKLDQRRLRLSNPEKQRFYVQKWRAANLEFARESARKTAHRKRSTPRGTINNRISRSINYCILGAKGGKSWQSFVGYTLEDLMVHLERQFLIGMSWENRSDWHIDHIRPLSSFKFETIEDEEFRMAWGLSNLRPLWCADNLRKGAKWALSS